MDTCFSIRNNKLKFQIQSLTKQKKKHEEEEKAELKKKEEEADFWKTRFKCGRNIIFTLLKAARDNKQVSENFEQACECVI